MCNYCHNTEDEITRRSVNVVKRMVSLQYWCWKWNVIELVCIAPHRENLTSNALRCGSHSITPNYSGLGLGIALKLRSGAVVCQYSLAVSLPLQATMSVF